jgi:hypothetical protein
MDFELLTESQFKTKYEMSRKEAIDNIGGVDKLWQSFDDCMKENAPPYYGAAGGSLPSFLMFDGAMQLIDSILSIVNRKTPTQDGEVSTDYEELVLILKKAMFDDNPDISALNKRATDITKDMYGKDVTDCLKKAIQPKTP